MIKITLGLLEKISLTQNTSLIKLKHKNKKFKILQAILLVIGTISGVLFK